MSVFWETPSPKPLYWIGSSKRDLTEFPAAVRREAGYALYLAQIGMKAINVKPLKGFGGAGVLEVFSNYDGSAYRSVYTLKFAGAVFVLHAFRKKSKRGIATPPAHIQLIKQRLKIAAAEYKRLQEDIST